MSCSRVVLMVWRLLFLFFFFNDTATTEIYTLSLHDALPISCLRAHRTFRPKCRSRFPAQFPAGCCAAQSFILAGTRSEEHTSELQSRLHLVCRLLLEKKKKQDRYLATQRETYCQYATATTNC